MISDGSNIILKFLDKSLEEVTLSDVQELTEVSDSNLAIVTDNVSYDNIFCGRVGLKKEFKETFKSSLPIATTEISSWEERLSVFCTLNVSNVIVDANVSLKDTLYLVYRARFRAEPLTLILTEKVSYIS